MARMVRYGLGWLTKGSPAKRSLPHPTTEPGDSVHEEGVGAVEQGEASETSRMLSRMRKEQRLALSEFAPFTPEQAKEWTVPRVPRVGCCLLYTSPSPRDATLSRMPSSA